MSLTHTIDETKLLLSMGDTRHYANLPSPVKSTQSLSHASSAKTLTNTEKTVAMTSDNRESKPKLRKPAFSTKVKRAAKFAQPSTVTNSEKTLTMTSDVRGRNTKFEETPSLITQSIPKTQVRQSPKSRRRLRAPPIKPSCFCQDVTAGITQT